MFTGIKAFALLFPLLMSACETMVNNNNASQLTSIKASGGLEKAYWYTGKAELNRYDLKQNRYNGIHDGEVIKIFVTEDFLTDKQVKNDNYTNPNSVSVLKMNEIRRFTTGLYDYSIMTSVFTRADGSATEKITLSSQDWCGQTFVQLNKNGKKYDIQLRSYFESEGDKNLSVQADLLEDELMNLVRIDPALIPEGNVDMLPSLTALRFSHDKHQVVPAIITKSNYTGAQYNGMDLRQIEIAYTTKNRSVVIVYNPHDHNKILAWTEERTSSFDNSVRTTEEISTHELYNAYWQLNAPRDTTLRVDLGIE